jgi:hypothetical protein
MSAASCSNSEEFFSLCILVPSVVDALNELTTEDTKVHKGCNNEILCLKRN